MSLIETGMFIFVPKFGHYTEDLVNPALVFLNKTRTKLGILNYLRKKCHAYINIWNRNMFAYNDVQVHLVLWKICANIQI